MVYFTGVQIVLCFYFPKTYLALTVGYLQCHQSPILLEDEFQKCLEVVNLCLRSIY